MRTISAVLFAVLMVIAPGFCSAQAWLPDKGEGTVSITYQNVNSAGHFLENGARWPGYQSRANDVVLGLDYGLTDRLALGVSLPYIVTRYTGKEQPVNTPENVLDDGNYHGAFQDFQAGLRYNLMRRPLAVTPFFTVVLPSHDYDVIGEAAPGPGLYQFISGVYAGRLLSPLLPRTYVDGMYSYAVVEKVAGIPLNRSNMEFSAGYFLTRSLSASFLWRRQWMHGGLKFSEIDAGSSEVYRQGDRVTRQNFTHIGADVALSLSESVTTHVSYIRFVAGQNAHFGEAIFAGISWHFSAH